MLQSYNDKKQKGFCEKERGCVGDVKICISPQFWTSDEREVTKGSLGNVKNSHFTTVLGVRRARSDERVVSRRCQPNPPGVKRKKKIFKEVLIHIHSQQLFSAQQFSAAILSYHVAVVRGWLSAILIRLLWSGVGGQPFSSSCCGQGLVVSYSHHVAVVRGWWSAILIILLWSGVGGQLLSHHVAVVRGWWSAILIMLLWSGVGGQLLSHHVAVVRGWWSTIVTSCCCGQGMLLWQGFGGQLLSHWSGAGGQLLARSLEGPFPGAFEKNNFCPEWVP